MDEYTLSSISNSGSFNGFPTINKKQIILDWINTINEPQCLLVSGLNDLKDGKVFLEILRHFLYLNNNKQLLYEFFSNDINSSSPERRIQILIELLLKISNEEEANILNNFYNIANRIIFDDDLLIEFASVIRDFFEKEKNCNEEPRTNNQRGMKIEDLENSNINITHKNMRASQELLEKYNSSNNYCNYVTNYPSCARMNFTQTDPLPSPIPMNSQGSTITHTQKNTLTASPIRHQYQSNTIDTNRKNNEMLTNRTEDIMQITHNNTLSLTPTKKERTVRRKNSYTTNMTNSNMSFTNSNDNSFCFVNEATKAYTKRQKAIINMTRGMLSTNNKVFNIETSMFKLKYAKFIKPTEPIIEVCYNNIKKYNVISRMNETIQRFNSTPVKKKNNVMQRQSVTAQKPKQSQPMMNITQEVDNEDNTVNSSIKTKIYNWLIDIGIIKEKVIPINNIPNICINGVLLCDLVNRCEGREERIKGIIRKTTTRSQIQVNINKVLYYLRSIEKFSSKHLWSGNEISKGNKIVIWELLNDIFTYYAKRKGYTKSTSLNHTMNRSKGKSNTSFIQKQKENDIFNDESMSSFTNSNMNISNISNVINRPNSSVITNNISNIQNKNTLNHIINQDDSEMFSLNKKVYSKPIASKIPRPKTPSTVTKRNIQTPSKIRNTSNNNSYYNTSKYYSTRYRGTYSNQTTGGNSTKSFIIF